MLSGSILQGFNATVSAVTPADPGDSIYVVKILHASSSKSGKPISPLALERFLAVRVPGSPFGWQLANAFPLVTKGWVRRTVGRITFCYAPGQIQSTAKEKAAAAFVDSVARLFRIEPPAHINEYLGASTEEAWRALGVDYFPDGSGPGTGFGGRTLGWAHIVLIGDPRVGEAYLHELVHVTLADRLVGGTGAFNEGVAVWLGGSDGRPLAEMYPRLLRYQTAHPEMTISQLLSGDAPGNSDFSQAIYATNGLIAYSIFRDSGIDGLLKFAKLKGSPNDMLKALPDYIPEIDKSGGVDAWWRNTAKRLASEHLSAKY